MLWTSLTGNCSAALEAHLKLSRSATSSAPARARVKTHRFADSREFRQAYRRADVFVDTGNFGAHSTALLGVWLGVLMLTAPGTQFNCCTGTRVLYWYKSASTDT